MLAIMRLMNNDTPQHTTVNTNLAMTVGAVATTLASAGACSKTGGGVNETVRGRGAYYREKGA